MSDTIELLEAIGSDASLRHASSEELTRVLEVASASKGLLQMVESGSCALLTQELGLIQMHTEHATQTGAHEGEDDDNDDDRQPGDEDKDDDNGDDDGGESADAESGGPSPGPDTRTH